ncbi:MAG: hypothetical protein ACTII3_02170 [Galactobacter sp.]
MATRDEAANARYNPLRSSSLALGGRRLMLLTPPEAAVRLGIDTFLEHGFANLEEDFDAVVRAEESGWVADAVWIGDSKRSWRRGVVADLLGPTLLPLVVPALRPGIPPTLVVVAARVLEDGTTELLVMPHESTKGDPEAQGGASAKVQAGTDAVQASVAREGTLLAVDRKALPRFDLRDPECPASMMAVRRLIGWK